MKLLPLSAIVVAALSFNAMAYDYTINNESTYEMVVYNGATGNSEIILPNSSRTLSLTDGDPYQIQYAGGFPFDPDYLGSITRDGHSGWISVTYQQPSNTDVYWWSRNMSIGSTYYEDAQIKSWPDAATIPGCDNRNWGTICSAQGTEASVTFTNE